MVNLNDVATEQEALTSASVPTTGERFLKLFEQLQITKVVLVDDRLEIPLDAALATRIFSDKEEAREAGTAFFPDVVLSDENEQVFEQVEAVLATMEADRRAELATMLAQFDERAADVNVARDLTDLLPPNDSTICVAINKPKPLPCVLGFSVTNGSNSATSTDGSTPGPLSQMRKR